MEVLLRYGEEAKATRERLVTAFPHLDTEIIDDLINISLGDAEAKVDLEVPADVLIRSFHRRIFYKLRDELPELDEAVLREHIFGADWLFVDDFRMSSKSANSPTVLNLDEFTKSAASSATAFDGDSDGSHSTKRTRKIRLFKMWDKNLQDELKGIWEANSPYDTENTETIVKKEIVARLEAISYEFFANHMDDPIFLKGEPMDIGTLSRIAQREKWLYAYAPKSKRAEPTSPEARQVVKEGEEDTV